MAKMYKDEHIQMLRDAVHIVTEALVKNTSDSEELGKKVPVHSIRHVVPALTDFVDKFEFLSWVIFALHYLGMRHFDAECVHWIAHAAFSDDIDKETDPNLCAFDQSDATTRDALLGIGKEYLQLQDDYTRKGHFPGTPASDSMRDFKIAELKKILATSWHSSEVKDATQRELNKLQGKKAEEKVQSKRPNVPIEDLQKLILEKHRRTHSKEEAAAKWIHNYIRWPNQFQVSRRRRYASCLENYEDFLETYWNTVQNNAVRKRKRDAAQTQDTTQTTMPDFDHHLVMALTLARFELREDQTVDSKPPY